MRGIETVDNGEILADVVLCNYPNSGPNVIVEQLPYGVSPMDTVLDIERDIDIEREYHNLAAIHDPDIAEETYDYDYANYENWAIIG